jgi:competence protein ComEC
MSPLSWSLCAVLGVWSGDVAVALVAGAAIALGYIALSPALRAVATPRRIAAMAGSIALAGGLAAVGAVRSADSWAALAPNSLGPYRGWVRLVDDPQPYQASTRVIVEIDGERFEVWSRGRAQQLRVRGWRGGEWVTVDGIRSGLDDQRARRVAWQHVVGEFRLQWASDVDAGGGLAVASNRIRAAIERSAATLPHDDGALFRGLVVGDDRDQPRSMIEAFRTSGLSHLTAVSGQNVAFVLAAAGPLLRRMRPWGRWAVTLALTGWFVTLTRFEPSIVRAGAMAALSATAFVLGRERAPLDVLAAAVMVLVLVDPLLVWSVGFWLSVGATAGVCTIGPWLAGRLAWMGLLALPIGITLGAQAGVAVPSVLVFGRLPLVSIPANLLAVPVAGAVMLYGLPAGLLVGWWGWSAPLVMFPARLGTRWVDTVARIGAELEPGPEGQLVGWLIIVAVIGTAVALIRRKR